MHFMKQLVVKSTYLKNMIGAFYLNLMLYGLIAIKYIKSTSLVRINLIYLGMSND